MSRPIITLTTDFGDGGTYVAQMKGVILSLNPQAVIVDITHSIAPQDVHGAALVLADVCRCFPPATIHVAVVDPGVGTQRSIVYAAVGPHQFLAPDNGLLTCVVRRTAPRQLIRLVDRRFWREDVSATFHGRDILAPVAAHLSLGVDPASLGPAHEGLVLLDLSEPHSLVDGIVGAVVSVDAFGNLVTNIDASLLPPGVPRETLRIRCRGETIEGLVSTYGERDQATSVALIGSNGRLEIAVVQGNAAARFQAQPGEEVVVEFRGAR